ncbi:uncharacterized protein ARB_07594 [Trichophyton benhamiae CBS 112371]|uniref:MOZ protein represents a chromatin-associated acetyltransferase n=1 Tax=Arthroderma benhamiae (strain ATCC MYA-4681 / CBS 112371) TaxID=663331 RepID=D4ATN0_ARTBC|nr:uncharacterized protein ARB_07594 [Trichophyton benhamiae CBS 112371]EFE33649.1 conserved hypothetical protein [Trichophyton benhamiae CBS 112371]
MAHQRLPFLYPNLLRSVRACEPTTYRSIRCPVQRTHSAGLHSSRACEQNTRFQKRYGPAVEPRVPSSEGSSTRPESSQNKVSKGEPDQRTAKDDKAVDDTKPPSKRSASEGGTQSPDKAQTKDAASGSASENTVDGNVEQIEPPGLIEIGSASGAPSQGDLGSVYKMSKSESQKDTDQSQSNAMEPYIHPPSHKHPHSSSFVHHFDTYTMVKDLNKSGFTEQQSIAIAKSIRGLLAGNLETTRSRLMSKSDFENEVYLFRAACSELQTSIQTSRNTEIQSQRTRRALIQHELDILTQRMTQDLAGLKDDLKEMFNNQKISTRELQRSIDTAIQELNYQITVSLNSDGKSEVEGLRWVLTRRAVIAVATSASMIILALRYQSYRVQQHEAAKKAAAESEEVAIGDIVQVTKQ